ncbi:oligogalacturonate-specific porin KdgM family protein [Modicisalibacter radicis]|uniref:oligogalacturonate-specific porin KdgM family protein n=1 Tax=Halomonas sp. EAR18 TaxID=2518972 RepID=UPI00109C255F|nr:oligogalacturonate-specific porin KdgM family protein [Halomonas sp. EAR18]
MNNKLRINLARYAITSVLAGSIGVPMVANASETSLVIKYQQTFKENKYYRPLVGVFHKFDNNLKLGFVHKRQWREEVKTSGFPKFQETVVSAAYGIKLGKNGKATLTPAIEYKFNHKKETVRPSVKIFYRLNNEWGVGARYRYEYQVHNGINGKLSRINRYDLYLDYNVSDDFSLEWNPSYGDMLGEGGGTFYTDENYRIEHEFTASYKVNAKNAVAITYKRKDETFENSKYNGGKNDDAVQLAYRYVF